MIRTIGVLAALALAGCATHPPPQTVIQTRLQYVAPQVPTAYQGCARDPVLVVKPHIAANDPHGGSKAATYIARDDAYKVDLLAVADQCRAALNGLNAYLSAMNKAALAANKVTQ